jgi:putative transposase
LIKCDITAIKPLNKLFSDITEIQCCDGKLYVSTVLDCYNGEILSVAMDNHIKKEFYIRNINEFEL